MTQERREEKQMPSSATQSSSSPWQPVGAAASERDSSTPKWPLPLRAAVVVGLGAASWAPILLLLA